MSSAAEPPPADAELDAYLEWERQQTGNHFARTELRVSSRRRTLDCHHTIDRTEPYRYFVSKPRASETLVQRSDCDVCMRSDDRY